MDTLLIPHQLISHERHRDLHHLYPRSPRERAAWIEANRALVPFALAPLFARYPQLSEDDRADVQAAGYRALVLSVDKFDPSAGVKLSTYAYRLVEFAGRKALAKCGDWKAKRAGVSVGSLDAPIESGDGTTARGDLVADEHAGEPFAQLLDTAGDTDGAARLWTWIRDTVTPRQLKALRLYFADGKSNAETAAALGLSTQGASQRVQSGLERLRKAAQTERGRRTVAAILDGE